MTCLATSANIGGTTSTKMKTASMASFIEGEVVALDPKFANTFAFSGVNSATYVPLAALKINRVYNDESCFGEIDLLQLAGANIVNNQSVTIGLFLGATVTGDVDFEYQNEQQSVVSYAELTPTGGGANTIANLADINPLYELLVASDSSQTIDITNLKISIGLGDTLLIALKTSASVSGQVSLTWFEQQ